MRSTIATLLFAWFLCPGILPGQAAGEDPRIRDLTLEEKASLTTGRNFWETRDVPRLEIPAAWMADGPVGLRKSTGPGVANSLPAEIVQSVRFAGKPFAVVLVGGGAIAVRAFADDANAILTGWLGGQAFGDAVARILFGEDNPSGKLSETFARTAGDHGAALNFPGGDWTVTYGEGLYVGYRYFQTFGRDVAYPFGQDFPTPPSTT